jgi:hypothetical protein
VAGLATFSDSPVARATSTFVTATARYEPQDCSEFARLQRPMERQSHRLTGKATGTMQSSIKQSICPVIHSRLREVVPIAKASEACAIVTVSMDIEQLVYEGE